MLTRIDHLGIAVARIADRIGFWSDGLGLGEPHLEEVAGERVRVAMLAVGSSRIELLEPTAEDSPIAAFLRTRGEGIHHIAFAVADLDAACERLRAEEQRLIEPAPRLGAGGHRVAFVHPRSAGGVLVELVERRPGPGA